MAVIADAHVIVAVHVNGTGPVGVALRGRRNRMTERPRTLGMLSFQKLDVYQCSIDDGPAYDRGIELLERIVATLTKLIDP